MLLHTPLHCPATPRKEDNIDAEEIIHQTLLVLTLGDIRLTFQPASRLGGSKKVVARAVGWGCSLGMTCLADVVAR